MQRKSMMTALVAAAFALPLAATAGGVDKTTGAKSASMTNGAHDARTETFRTMDKNGDGFISMEETMGTPHHAYFARMDKNGDGRLSHDELAGSHGEVAGQTAARPNTATGVKNTLPADTKSLGK